MHAAGQVYRRVKKRQRVYYTLPPGAKGPNVVIATAASAITVCTSPHSAALLRNPQPASSCYFRQWGMPRVLRPWVKLGDLFDAGPWGLGLEGHVASNLRGRTTGTIAHA